MCLSSITPWGQIKFFELNWNSTQDGDDYFSRFIFFLLLALAVPHLLFIILQWSRRTIQKQLDSTSDACHSAGTWDWLMWTFGDQNRRPLAQGVNLTIPLSFVSINVHSAASSRFLPSFNPRSPILSLAASSTPNPCPPSSSQVEVKPYVLDDQLCDECQGTRCGGKFAPFFCANVTCLQYYCEYCWAAIHSRAGREFHKPLVKEGDDRPRHISFRWNWAAGGADDTETEGEATGEERRGGEGEVA